MSVFADFRQDLTYGLRMLRREGRFTFLAVLGLALGIGAVTVMFSVVYSVLVKTFPYANADRLAMIYEHFESGSLDRPWLSSREFLEFKEQNRSFEDMIAVGSLDLAYDHEGGQRPVWGAWMTVNAFEFLGVKPFLGRPFSAEDGTPDAPPTFAMSYELWSKEFNRDPSIVGKALTLNKRPRILVAILPPHSRLLDYDIWIPVNVRPDTVGLGSANRPASFQAIGRLKQGVRLGAAAADIDVIAQRLAAIHPEDYPERFSILIRTLADTQVGDFAWKIWALMLAVCMLLLIACSNVANLLLARATVREREIVIRMSLGAGRSRLIRQFFVESLLLAMGGWVLGCVLAYLGLYGFTTIVPQNVIPSEVVIAMRPLALAFALGVALLTSLLFGLVPAIHTRADNLNARLAAGGKGANRNFRHGGFRAGLVIIEVGLSTVLLIGSVLMMRSLFALHHVDLGFSPQNVIFARLSLPEGRYETTEQQRMFFLRTLENVTSIPGVIASTTSGSAPPPDGAPLSLLTIEGKVHSEPWYVQFGLCSESYFQTLGIQLMQGRVFSGSEVNSGKRVAVINLALARAYFHEEDPIGKKIELSSFDTLPDYPHNAYFEIIGVVGDAKNRGLHDPAMPEAYIPYTTTAVGTRNLLVKSAGVSSSLLNSVRREVWALDPDVALADTGSIEGQLREEFYAEPQFVSFVLVALGGIGLALVLIGVFSVMGYIVALRTQEIGVRVALGAGNNDILKMVLLKGLRMIGAGLGAGLIASFVLGRVAASQVWGVSASDPATFLSVSAVLILAGATACFLPARRATRVDPLVAIRYE
jgi:putative ABC transport system permease protein